MAKAQLNLTIQPYRMLMKTEAAAYCGLSTSSFVITCPVKAVLLPGGNRLWDVQDLDQWIDHLKDGCKPSDDDLLNQLEA